MFIIQKRGQIQSQMFVYILAVILMAIILLFGYKALTTLQKKGDDAALLQFKTQLKSDIEQLSSHYGDVKIGKYKIPSGFDEICFVDLESVNPSDILDPIIKDSVESGVKQNIFLLGKKKFDSLYVEGVKLSSYPFFYCVSPDTGSIEIRIEGKGTASVISAPLSQKYCQNAFNGKLCDGLDIVFGPGYKSQCCQDYNVCC